MYNGSGYLKSQLLPDILPGGAETDAVTFRYIVGNSKNVLLGWLSIDFIGLFGSEITMFPQFIFFKLTSRFSNHSSFILPI